MIRLFTIDTLVRLCLALSRAVISGFLTNSCGYSITGKLFNKGAFVQNVLESTQTENNRAGSLTGEWYHSNLLCQNQYNVVDRYDR